MAVRLPHHSVFGKLSFPRHYFYQAEEGGMCPLDAALRLPKRGSSDLLRDWLSTRSPLLHNFSRWSERCSCAPVPIAGYRVRRVVAFWVLPGEELIKVAQSSCSPTAIGE
jgi:hypothetical protein